MVRLFTLTLWLFNIAFRGFVVSHMWFWFMVKSFNVPAISTTAAIGLMFLITTMSPWKIHSDEEINKIKNSSQESSIFNGIVHFLTACLMLGAGYIVHILMA